MRTTTPRWTAATPGMPARFTRLRFFAEPAGGDTGAAAAEATQAGATPTPGTSSATPAAPAAPTPTPVPAPAAGQSFSPEYVAELRSEAAEHRVKARDAATANETLTAENATLKAQLVELQTATILDAAITKAGGATITKAALKGDGILAGLDPAAADYATKVDEAVTKYLTDHPELKAAPGATRSSIPTAGGTGEGTTKPTTLSGAINAHYGA